jgi:Ino eighty subunit 2
MSNSESDLTDVENYDEEDQTSQLNSDADINDQLEDDGDEEMLDDDEEDQEGEVEEEEEEEEDDEEGEGEGDDDDNPAEYSEQTPLYSDNEEIEEFNDDDDDDDDFELGKKPKKQAKLPASKLKVKLTLSKPSPLSKSVAPNYEEAEPSNAPRKVGRPKKNKATTTAKKVKPNVGERVKRQAKKVDYDDYDSYDNYDEQYLSDDDIIPTPALDDEGLSEDEQQYQPDVTKMTERQRARLLDDDNDTDGGDSKLLSLGDKKSKKKVLTAEETELRKAEIARKRKNMLEKKLDEEKQDTINKLLKRRAVKTGTRSKKSLDEEVDEEGRLRERPRRPQLDHPALLRWVSRGESLQLRVPDALLAQEK